MDKEFVQYNEAIALKELGFDDPCFSDYTNGVLQPSLNPKDYSYFNEMSEINPNMKNFEFVLAPLYQQAFRWFRDNYQLEHKILRDSYGCRYQITKVTSTSLEDIDCKGQYSNTSYEEAELACLKRLINTIKHGD